MNKIEKMLITVPTWVVFCGICFPLLVGDMIPFGTSILFFVLFGCLSLVGLILQGKASHYLEKTTLLLKICFSFLVVYVTLLEAVWGLQPPPYFFVFHLIAMFCVMYPVYFFARALVVAESKQRLSFDRYIGTFFLIWFFPIGVWFVHPRIRKVLFS